MAEPKKRFRKRTILAAGVAIIAGVLFIGWLGVRLMPPTKAMETEELLSRPERLALLRPDEIIALINPAPGATVLDVGAGYGMMTLPLAQKVGKTGKVFATEINPEAIENLKLKAQALGLDNVTPVKVERGYNEAFYESRNFDVIVTVDLLPLLTDIPRFFRPMSRHLTPVTGRLWVVQARLDPDFVAEEFADPKAVRAMSPLTLEQEALLRRVGVTPEAAASDKAALAAALNSLLSAPDLVDEAKLQRWPLNPREAKARDHLGEILAHAKLSAAAHATARRVLNRLLIQDLFGLDLWERILGLDTLTSGDWHPLLMRIAAGQNYVAEFGESGFSLVQDHKVGPFHYILEFRRS